MNREEAKRIIEALLFISGKPVTIKDFQEIIEEYEAPTLQEILEELGAEYKNEGRSFGLAKISYGYQLLTNPQYAPWINKMQLARNHKTMSRPALETLAIIAYRQPIIRAEIESIRGVNVDGVLRTLLERNLIRVAGRQSSPGRPLLYATNEEFLRYFGLKEISELPRLEEWKNII
jgi:segregation and condensation protein B